MSDLLSNDTQSRISSSIDFAAEMIKRAWAQAAYDHSTPAAIFRPRVFIDGDKWCALYGENLQDGVAGFGDSPALAVWDFNEAWNKKLPEKTS